jgi:tetratricopeptide (TPR) repeat protein
MRFFSFLACLILLAPVFARKVLEEGEKARARFNAIIQAGRSGPNAEEALYRLGQYHYARGQYSEAAEFWARQVKEYPKGNFTTNGVFWLGLAYLAGNHEARAKEVLSAITTGNPRAYICAQIALGFLYARQKNIPESDRHIQNGLKYGDNAMRSTAYYQLFLNSLAQNSTASAEAVAAKLLAEFPRSLEVELLRQEHGRALSGAVKTPGAARGSYTLQLGAFGLKENAERLRERIKVTWDDVEIVPVNKGATMLYLVWLGHFKDRAEAEVFARGKLSDEAQAYQIKKRD